MIASGAMYSGVPVIELAWSHLGAVAAQFLDQTEVEDLESTSAARPGCRA